MSKKQWWIVVGVALVAAIAVIFTYTLVRGQQTTVAATPVPTVVATPSASATPSATPTATESPSATTEPSSSAPATQKPTSPETTKPTQSPTATDPTQEWEDPVDCPPGNPDSYMHLGQCKVKGKTQLQVYQACRAAALGSMARISGGEAGDKSEIDDLFDNIEICLKGSGFYTGSSYDGGIYVEGCPLNCKDTKSRKGLQYIMLTGGMKDGGYIETSLLFDAKTGNVLDNSTARKQLNIWNSQFESSESGG